MLAWIVAAIALVALVAAIVVSSRAQRQLRLVHEETIASKNEQIASLEAQLVALRESESLRFVDRYVAAKKGLEERTSNLHDKLEAIRAEQDKLRVELNDLDLSEVERETEMERLRRDLQKTTDQIRRLELVLREVTAVGLMDVEPIRVELDGRRELASHIRGRLERLDLEEHDRVSLRRSRTQKLEKLNEEAARIRRDLEITKAAAGIVDGILGIDAETRKRLAQHASEQIDGALKLIGEAADRGPLSKFIDVFEQQRPDRLLERGKPSAPTGDGQAADGEPAAVGAVPTATAPPSPAVDSTGEASAGSRPEPTIGPYWTVVP